MEEALKHAHKSMEGMSLQQLAELSRQGAEFAMGDQAPLNPRQVAEIDDKKIVKMTWGECHEYFQGKIQQHNNKVAQSGGENEI